MLTTVTVQRISDVSDDTVLVALQGKNALPILQALTKIDISSIDYYWFAEDKVKGIPALISRTGYTGKLDLSYMWMRIAARRCGRLYMMPH